MERVTADDIVKMGLGAKEKVEGFVNEVMKQGDISKEQGTESLNNKHNKIYNMILTMHLCHTFFEKSRGRCKSTKT